MKKQELRCLRSAGLGGRSSWQLALALCSGPMRQPFRRHLCSLSHGFAAGQSPNHRGAMQRFITTQAASGKARPQVQCSFEPQGGTAAQPTAHGALNSAAKRFLGHNEPTCNLLAVSCGHSLFYIPGPSPHRTVKPTPPSPVRIWSISSSLFTSAQVSPPVSG